MEKIIDIFKELDKNYKGDPKNIERYKKVKSEHENFKLEIIRKRKLNNMRLRQEEKGRKILEHHRKVRFYHLNKNGTDVAVYHWKICNFAPHEQG